MRRNTLYLGELEILAPVSQNLCRIVIRICDFARQSTRCRERESFDNNGAFTRFDWLALYGGPSQVMTVTSGLASIIGVVLIFWNTLVAAFLKFVHVFRRSAQRAPPHSGAPRQIPLRFFLRKKVIVIGLDGLEPTIVESTNMPHKFFSSHPPKTSLR